jgi:hypothetical protein
MYAIMLCWSGRRIANLNAPPPPPISNLLCQVTATRQQTHKLRIAIQRSFDGLKNARNVAICLIAGRGGKGGKGARGGDNGRGGGSGKDGGNPWGGDGNSGDLWIETLETTTTKRHEKENTFVDDHHHANGSKKVKQQYMGTSNLDPTIKHFCSNVKVMNMEEDSEGKCCEKPFKTLVFSSRCKCVRKNL